MAAHSSTVIHPLRMVAGGSAVASPPFWMARPSGTATLSQIVAPPVLSAIRPLGALRSPSSRGPRTASDGMRASQGSEPVAPLVSGPQRGDFIRTPMLRFPTASPSLPKCEINSEAGSFKFPSIGDVLRSSTHSSRRENTLLKSDPVAVWTTSFLLAPYLLPLHSLAGPYEGGPSPAPLFDLSELDPASASFLSSIFGPLFSILTFLFIIRIVMTWYPQLPANKFPFFLAYIPTEIVLRPTRQLIPPVGGVDVSPVIWVALISFLNEILLGQQGLLVLLAQKQV